MNNNYFAGVRFTTFTINQVYHSLPEEPAYVESALEYIEPPASLPLQPQVVQQAAAYFPVDIEYATLIILVC